MVATVRLALGTRTPSWVGQRSERTTRAALALVGVTPVSLIALATFGIGLRELALRILVPGVAAVALFVRGRKGTATIVVAALGCGFLATGLYDLSRFTFLWTGLMNRDPIPHIGVALGLRPAWVFGYAWRYFGNGSGLALAFLAAGLRGIRAGLLYGLAVCAGLVATLIVSPYGQQALFPLTLTTVVMATIGHLIYGAVLGALSARYLTTGDEPLHRLGTPWTRGG